MRVGRFLCAIILMISIYSTNFLYASNPNKFKLVYYNSKLEIIEVNNRFSLPGKSLEDIEFKWYIDDILQEDHIGRSFMNPMFGHIKCKFTDKNNEDILLQYIVSEEDKKVNYVLNPVVEKSLKKIFQDDYVLPGLIDRFIKFDTTDIVENETDIYYGLSPDQLFVIDEKPELYKVELDELKEIVFLSTTALQDTSKKDTTKRLEKCKFRDLISISNQSTTSTIDIYPLTDDERYGIYNNLEEIAPNLKNMIDKRAILKNSEFTTMDLERVDIHSIDNNFSTFMDEIYNSKSINYIQVTDKSLKDKIKLKNGLIKLYKVNNNQTVILDDGSISYNNFYYNHQHTNYYPLVNSPNKFTILPVKLGYYHIYGNSGEYHRDIENYHPIEYNKIEYISGFTKEVDINKVKITFDSDEQSYLMSYAVFDNNGFMIYDFRDKAIDVGKNVIEFDISDIRYNGFFLAMKFGDELKTVVNLEELK